MKKHVIFFFCFVPLVWLLFCYGIYLTTLSIILFQHIENSYSVHMLYLKNNSNNHFIQEHTIWYRPILIYNAVTHYLALFTLRTFVIALKGQLKLLVCCMPLPVHRSVRPRTPVQAVSRQRTRVWDYTSSLGYGALVPRVLAAAIYWQPTQSQSDQYRT